MYFARLRCALRVSSLLTLALLAACEEVPEPTEQTVNAEEGVQTSAVEHAPAGAVPGSHEDWCGGHGVPESLCTRCNPRLIGAFQATGDWCPEHNLPESQCTICNPDLVIERPPRTNEAAP
ncbi:MAG: hypothetical protein AB8H86_19970 [Polyangiales bacterium]